MEQATQPGNAVFITVIQFALIIGIVYFMLLRPGAKARKEAAEMRANLKKGDDVVTAAGIVGKIREIKDDLITLESGNAQFLMERQGIIRVGSARSAKGDN